MPAVRPTPPLAVAVLAFAVAACSLVPSPAVSRPEALRRDLAANAATWRALGATHYRFTVTFSCFCPDTQPVDVEVRDGAVVSATRAGEPVGAEVLQRVPLTIPEAFDRVESALEADAVEVAWDRATGIPIRVVVDPEANMFDEQWSIEIRDFAVLP